jgi:hypothetical protein
MAREERVKGAPLVLFEEPSRTEAKAGTKSDK